MERHLGAPLHSVQGGAKFWKIGVRRSKFLENWGQAEVKRHCVDFVEAVNHPTLHPTSIVHVHEVFEHLHMLWKSIWVHPYTVIMVQGGVQMLENWGQQAGLK